MNISDFHIPSSHKEKYFNPYSHFARDTNTDRFTLIDEHGHGDEKKKHKEDIHEYKICEIRPPSIEKVLNTDFIMILVMVTFLYLQVYSILVNKTVEMHML